MIWVSCLIDYNVVFSVNFNVLFLSTVIFKRCDMKKWQVFETLYYSHILSYRAGFQFDVSKLVKMMGPLY